MFKRCNEAGAHSGRNASGRGLFSRISALLVAHLAVLNHTPRALILGENCSRRTRGQF